MIIRYDITGQRRKDLVKALGEITLWEPVYRGAPSFSYTVGNYTVDRNGAVICPDTAPREILRQLVENLKKRGFTPVESGLDAITISLPIQGIDDPTINRLRNLVSSKATVLKSALETTELPIELDSEKISFPWFTYHGIDGEVDAYQKLVFALIETAKKLKYVSETEKPQENLKYTMRLFLVRLGFVGEEYKQARKILLRNLSGNCSWKSGHAPEPDPKGGASDV